MINMSPALHRIRSEALQLSEEEREALASELWSSLEDSTESAASIDAAWNAEIAARVQDIRDGKVEGVPHDQVEAQMRARFSWLQQ